MDKLVLITLYNQGKSLTDIAICSKCSIHKVVYWMKKYEIPRRSRSDAAYIKANPEGDPFNIRTSLTPAEQLLFGIGIGIYLGEGNKVVKQAIRVTNSDPIILKLFIKFLIRICQFSPKRMSYSIVCFKDTRPQSVRAYWSDQLQISPEKFGKITQIPHQGKGTYRKKSQFGVCTVQANNVKLTTWLREYIRIFVEDLPR